MGLSEKKFQRMNVPSGKRVTAGLGVHAHPALSPKGRWMAWAAEGGGDVHIYVGDRQGRLGRQISGGHGVHARAAWSPDGRTIAYGLRKTEQGRWQIWLGDRIDAALTRVLLSSTRFNYQFPAFSPEGGSLVFSSTQGSSDDTYNLWRVDLSTGEKEQLTEAAGRNDMLPRFDPSGQRLIFSAAPAGDLAATHLYSLDLESRGEERLTGGKKAMEDAILVDSRVAICTRRGKKGPSLVALDLERGATLMLVEDARHPTARVDADGIVELAWTGSAGVPGIYRGELADFKAERSARPVASDLEKQARS